MNKGKESSMKSFMELQSLVFTLSNALVPLFGQALVTGRLWGMADYFTRFAKHYFE